MKSFLLLSSLLFLVSCGKEQFGTAAKQESSQTDGLQTFSQNSCALHTLIKPKVDILYVVDNSGSATYLGESLKNEIKKTVDFISKDFDYRVINIPLIVSNLTESNPGNTQNYQVLTSDSTGLPHTSNRILSPSEFNFFNTAPSNEPEQGLNRVRHFMEAHKNSGLFRKGAYHLVVLVSNGRDEIVEETFNQNGETIQNQSLFSTRKTQFTNLRTDLTSAQFRFMAATASPGCSKSGWKSSKHSYQAMARYLYGKLPLDQKDNPQEDVYDLCASNGITGIFNAVNNSIKKITLAHKYRYWPISFAKDNEDIVNFQNIKVFRQTGTSTPVEIPSSEWSYYQNPNPSQPLNTREEPTPGEAVTGKHFVRFNNLVSYPDCVQVTTTSKLEYFGWVVLPRPAQPQSIVIRINGTQIPSEDFTYNSTAVTVQTNIKVEYNGSSLIPEVKKTGYFIKINNPTYYYKSGDNVEVNYTPDAI